MAQNDRLSGFVGAALSAGRSRGEIAAALEAAGWSDREVADGLANFADTGFTPPVPAPAPVVSARDFFVHALIFVSLGLSAWYLVDLAHAVIDLRWPALPDQPGEWRARGMNYAIAMVAVFGPIWAYLTRLTQKARADDPARHRSAVRRWTAAIILLLTMLALLGTLASVVFGFLQGEADLKFLLKAGVAAAVAGGIFALYRRADG